MGRASFFWSAVRNWGSRFGSLLVFMILARFLPRDQLGLFSASLAVMALVELLAENGIGDAVVQKPDLTDDELTVGLVVNVAFALLVAGGLILFAPQIGHLMGAPGMAALLPYTGGAIVLNAFSYAPQAVLRRQFAFRWLAIRALCAALIGGVIGVIMAFLGFGVWSMVAQLLLTAAVNTIVVWIKPSWKLTWPFRLSSAKSLLAFGSSVFLGRVLFYLSGRSIELAITAAFGPAMLALYIMGSRLAAVLMQLLSAVTLDVSLPHFSRAASERPQLIQAYYDTVEMCAAIMLYAFVLLSATSLEVCRIAFGANGAGSEYVLLPFALVGAVQIYQFLSSTAVTAAGMPSLATGLLAVKVVITLTALAITWHTSLYIMVTSYVIAELIYTPLNIWVCARRLGFSTWQVLRISAPFALASAGMFAAVRLAEQVLLPFIPHPIILLILLGGMGSTVYLALAWLVDTRSVRRVLKVLLRRRRHTAAPAT